jgi:hypothetical protein
MTALAQSGPAEGQPRCPLLGVTRTSQALRANRVITTDDDSASITTTDTAAAKCPRVVNGSLTGSEHHRSRSEGTLRRHRSNHDASSPRRDRAPASSARPSPIPHRVRDRTTTPSSRRLPEQIPSWGIWKLATVTIVGRPPSSEGPPSLRRSPLALARITTGARTASSHHVTH